MLPDPWSTPTEYPQSPLYNSQASPDLFQRLLGRARQAGSQMRQGGSSVATTARQAGQAVAERPGMYGALGTAAAYGGSQLLQGDPIGALAGGLGSLVGGGAGAGLAGLIPGSLGKIAKFGLPIVGGLIGGGVAEQAATGLGAKAQEAGQRPGAGPDVEFGGVPLTETAATRKQREFDRQQQALDIQRLGGAEMALNKEILDYMMNKEIEQQKAILPLEERRMRTQLTNAQAMLASQTAAYQQLGRQATMGKLAVGAQQERGDTMRTALSQNPYMGSVIQAPSISF